MKGKTALITGSSGGLGYAMAQGLAQAGCNVVLHGLEPAETMAGRCADLAEAHGVSAIYLQADLADPQAIDRLVSESCQRVGGIDVLVNNAVVRHYADTADFPVQKWDQAVAVNLSAAFHTIRLTLPGMRERGWGRIINMSSVYGSRAAVNRIDYVTTKTALLGMTRVVALENVGRGVTCNAVCPGSVLTPDTGARVDKLMAEHDLDRDSATRRFLAGKQPSQQFIPASDVAAMIVFLCGPASGHITGAMLPVEGGWLAS